MSEGITPLFTSWVTWGKSFHLSEPQILYLSNVIKTQTGSRLLSEVPGLGVLPLGPPVDNLGFLTAWQLGSEKASPEDRVEATSEAWL